jgi:hypothetical protein
VGHLGLAVACLADPANVDFYVVAKQAVNIGTVSDVLHRLARRKGRAFLNFATP